MNVPEWLIPTMHVEVDWVDITEDDEVCVDTKITPVYCRSIGWVDTFDERFLTIILEERGEVVDKQIFPWGVIIMLKELTPSARAYVGYVNGQAHTFGDKVEKVISTPQEPSN